MEMHRERGTREERGWGGGDEEDGRRVGDTGCDEAVDLICSPAPSSSFSASVTCVLSYLLHLPFSSLFLFPLCLLTSFSFVSNILAPLLFEFSQLHHQEYALSLSRCSLFYWFSWPFCSLFWLSFPVSPSPHHQLDIYSLYIFIWVFLPTHFPLFLYVHKHLTPSSSNPLPPPPPPPPSLARSISVLCSKTGALRQQEMGNRDNRKEGSVEGSLWCSPLKPKHVKEMWARYFQNLTFNFMWGMNKKIIFKAFIFHILLEYETLEFPHL